MHKKILALTLAAAVSAPVMAGDVYVGAALGSATLDFDELEQVAADGGASYDDSDIGGKVFIGYRVSPNFAVEGFYVNLGEIVAQDAFDRVTVDANTVGVAALFGAQLNENARIYGKIGMHSWDATLTVTGSVNGSLTDDGTDLMFGAGIGFDQGKITYQVEFERYNLDDAAVNLITAGISYTF